MKVGIICSGWTFMEEVLSSLKGRGEVSVLEEPYTTDRIKSFVKNGKIDILYVEWCAVYMVPVAESDLSCRIVNRVHGNEIYGNWIKDVDFNRVELIFVNDFWKDLSLTVCANMRKARKISVVQLGVNLDHFNSDPERGYGKRIGWVGYIKARKDPMIMFDLMKKLPDWLLYLHAIPSVYIDLNRKVIGSISHNVKWSSLWMNSKEMKNFYNSLDMFVNSSLVEGQAVTVLEAMSCGLYTLVRRWPHADELYPEELLWSTADECRGKILGWVKKSHDEKRRISSEMREFIQKNYDSKNYVEEMIRVICGES